MLIARPPNRPQARQPTRPYARPLADRLAGPTVPPARPPLQSDRLAESQRKLRGSPGGGSRTNSAEVGGMSAECQRNVSAEFRYDLSAEFGSARASARLMPARPPPPHTSRPRPPNRPPPASFPHNQVSRSLARPRATGSGSAVATRRSSQTGCHRSTRTMCASARRHSATSWTPTARPTKEV